MKKLKQRLTMHVECRDLTPLFSLISYSVYFLLFYLIVRDPLTPSTPIQDTLGKISGYTFAASSVLAFIIAIFLKKSKLPTADRRWFDVKKAVAIILFTLTLVLLIGAMIFGKD